MWIYKPELPTLINFTTFIQDDTGKMVCKKKFFTFNFADDTPMYYLSCYLRIFRCS